MNLFIFRWSDVSVVDGRALVQKSVRIESNHSYGIDHFRSFGSGLRLDCVELRLLSHLMFCRVTLSGG